MNKRSPARPALFFALILAALAAAPAMAESMAWTFGIYPALDAEMSSVTAARIYTKEDGKKSVRTRIVIKGNSEEDWTEMFEVFNSKPRNEPKSAKLWYERLKSSEDAGCPSEWVVVEESSDSMTFERHIPDCSAQAGQSILYRVMYAKYNVFALSAKLKGEVSDDLRKFWHAVLASAKIIP
jgi:hypothetical protein